MSTTITVNKQTVSQLLEGGKSNPFVIPEYQRPYAWSQDEIDTLYNDLWDFTITDGGPKRKGTYFLGSIVSFTNDNEEQEIIDGQQRVTSLFLLLRAIYTKLQKDPSTDAAKNFIRLIESAIWRTDEITGQVDYSDILLTSRVVNNEGNTILLNILKTGQADVKAKDNYSQNYIRFQQLLDNSSKEAPFSIFDFFHAILRQAIVLPISADNQDTALTIFSTLNDRGLPLSDADIFKATIYNKLTKEEKEVFIEQWKELDERAQYSRESVQKLFYYHMFCIRAEEKDSNSTLSGIRKYYSENKWSRLLEPSLMEKLQNLLNLWVVVNKRDTIEDEEWSKNKQVLQILDILSSYPNEFWKYPVICYYMSHKNNSDFSHRFLVFLRKLAAELVSRYLLTPTINAVKVDILKLNVNIINSPTPIFDFKKIDENELKNKVKVPHRSVVRMLLKMLAYEHQEELLPISWEIEHILPQRWQNSYFADYSEKEIKERIEHLGNKLPFEKKLNIIAGNGYFEKKKTFYEKSNIAITKSMAQASITEWGLENISENDVHQANVIMKILKEWKETYNTSDEQTEEIPTEEQLKFLAECKAKGWVKYIS